jgi:hypothetical protein
MIISASYRTDLPAFYGDWFMRRLATGSCRTVNPYNGRTVEISLTREAVDGFVFWTRNAGPFRDALERLADLGYPFVVQYTATAYPRALERSVVPAERSIALILELARRYGRRAVVWRYDPVMLTSLTPPAWHRRTFARLAERLAPACDEVVLSFAQIYAKTRANSDRAAKRFGFTWWDPEPEEKIRILRDLGELARDAGLKASLCAQPDLLAEPLEAARCIDSERLSDVSGLSIAAEIKGNRPGCLCARAQDLGVYDSCPHGCVYCYAVRRPEVAKRRHRDHDPENPFLIAPYAEGSARPPGSEESSLGAASGSSAPVSPLVAGGGAVAAGPPFATPTRAGRSKRSCNR